MRALNDSVLLKIPRAAFEAMLARSRGWPSAFTQRMGERMKQLREEKSRANVSTIIALFSAVPGAGKTLLATNLVASLARETGEPVLMLDFSGRLGGKPLGAMQAGGDLKRLGARAIDRRISPWATTGSISS